MVIFQYNLHIFGIHLKTVLYPKLCYKEVEVYYSGPLSLTFEGSEEAFGVKLAIMLVRENHG